MPFASRPQQHRQWQRWSNEPEDSLYFVNFGIAEISFGPATLYHAQALPETTLSRSCAGKLARQPASNMYAHAEVGSSSLLSDWLAGKTNSHYRWKTTTGTVVGDNLEFPEWNARTTIDEILIKIVKLRSLMNILKHRKAR